MTDPASDSPDLETSVMQLQARLEALETAGPRANMMARLLHYLPVIAVGNFALAAPAFLLSLAVAYFTFVQAEATEKMQYAGVLPLVVYETSNLTEEGDPLITLELTNQGVGPAIVRGMELSYRGEDYNNFERMLIACCDTPGKDWSMITSPINGRVLRPGETSRFVRVDPALVPSETYDKFNQERFMVAAKVCYCSVFDECWVIETPDPAPKPVDACPSDWVQYGFPTRSPRDP